MIMEVEHVIGGKINFLNFMFWGSIFLVTRFCIKKYPSTIMNPSLSHALTLSFHTTNLVHIYE